ncbi:MAG: DinB family protein [Chloroflexi bacterium]|nr:DinB family protein [Chloroflexota bacterium]
MSEDELEGLLRRIEEGKQRLIEAIARVSDEEFERQPPRGDSIRRLLEHASDEISFFFNRLLARARGLPPPSCITDAQFFSVREASMALQVVYRRLTNLLHDLTNADLERTAAHEERGAFTLRQVLQMAAGRLTETAERVEALHSTGREATAKG